MANERHGVTPSLRPMYDHDLGTDPQLSERVPGSACQADSLADRATTQSTKA